MSEFVMLKIINLNVIKTSQSQLNTVGLCDLKRHKPWFEEYLHILFNGIRLKCIWLWDPKII